MKRVEVNKFTQDDNRLAKVTDVPKVKRDVYRSSKMILDANERNGQRKALITTCPSFRPRPSLRPHPSLRPLPNDSSDG
jgi:hypothetical protein